MKKSIKHIMLFTAVFMLLSGCGDARPDFKDADINGTVTKPMKDAYSSYDELRNDLFNMLDLYETKDHKRIYSMGTLHCIYTLKELEFSFADLLDTIDMIQPDVLLLEMHDDCYQKFGAVDGPIEMSFACGYGESKGIPIYGIDYWELDNDILEKSGTTDNYRDNQMFYNIYDKVVEAPANTTIFVLYGGTHFYNAIPRMELAGWKRIDINTSDFYKHVERENYQYPEKLKNVLQNTINYYENQYVEKANNYITDESVREIFLEELADTVSLRKRVLEWLNYNTIY